MTTNHRNRYFEIRITSQEPYIPYNHDEVMYRLNGIANTQVIATSHRGNAHYYLIRSELPRVVGYYISRIEEGTVIPYKVDNGVNSKEKAISVWLYNKNL